MDSLKELVEAPLAPEREAMSARVAQVVAVLQTDSPVSASGPANGVYYRNSVQESQYCEVASLLFMEGLASPLHGHSESAVVLRVLGGRLMEESYWPVYENENEPPLGFEDSILREESEEAQDHFAQFAPSSSTGMPSTGMPSTVMPSTVMPSTSPSALALASALSLSTCSLSRREPCRFRDATGRRVREFQFRVRVLVGGETNFLPIGAYHRIHCLVEAPTVNLYAPRPSNTVAPVPEEIMPLLLSAKQAYIRVFTACAAAPTYTPRGPVGIAPLVAQFADVWAAREKDQTASGAIRVHPATVADWRHTGVFGAPIPIEYGGWGDSLSMVCATLRKLAAIAPATALCMTMPLGIAASATVPLDAVPEEHRKALTHNTLWLVQKIIRERKIMAVANSEPGAGGDLANTQTIAVRRPPPPLIKQQLIQEQQQQQQQPNQQQLNRQQQRYHQPQPPVEPETEAPPGEGEELLRTPPHTYTPPQTHSPPQKTDCKQPDCKQPDNRASPPHPHLFEFELSGRKSFATLGPDADYYMCAARRATEGGVVDGFFVAQQYVNLDQAWNPLGMRPTASVGLTLQCSAAECMLGFPGSLSGVNARHWSTLLFTAVFVGLAEGALACLTGKGGNEKGLLDSQARASAYTRCTVAQMALQIDCAAGFLEALADKHAMPFPAAARERCDNAKSFAAKVCVETATQVAQLAGGRAYKADHIATQFLHDALAAPLLRPPYAKVLDKIAAKILD